jgi:hypothetical protein
MRITISTPALLFPAISFLVLAYTNRYSALTRLVRDLLREYAVTPADHVVQQIRLVRTRVFLIRVMLTLAAVSMFLGVLTIFALYESWDLAAKVLFMGSLLGLSASYGLAVVEIQRSSRALDIQIEATIGAHGTA